MLSLRLLSLLYSIIPYIIYQREERERINKKEREERIRFIFTLSKDKPTVYVENFLNSNSFRDGYKKRQTNNVYLVNLVLHQSMCMLIGLPQCGHLMVGVSTLKNSDT